MTCFKCRAGFYSSDENSDLCTPCEVGAHNPRFPVSTNFGSKMSCHTGPHWLNRQSVQHERYGTRLRGSNGMRQLRQHGKLVSGENKRNYLHLVPTKHAALHDAAGCNHEARVPVQARQSPTLAILQLLAAPFHWRYPFSPHVLCALPNVDSVTIFISWDGLIRVLQPRRSCRRGQGSVFHGSNRNAGSSRKHRPCLARSLAYSSHSGSSSLAGV